MGHTCWLPSGSALEVANVANVAGGGRREVGRLQLEGG